MHHKLNHHEKEFINLSTYRSTERSTFFASRTAPWTAPLVESIKKILNRASARQPSGDLSFDARALARPR